MYMKNIRIMIIMNKKKEIIKLRQKKMRLNKIEFQI